VAGLCSAVNRMRLGSSDDVIRIAQQVIRQVIEAYATPDLSFDELRERAGSEAGIDPLRDFSEACRAELRG